MNTELLGQLWDKLATRQAEVVPLFYKRFFEQYPDYELLFSESREREMGKMLETVTKMARVAGESEMLHPQLVKLGEKHSHFQVTRGDLENFKTVYLQVLKELCGPDWTEECGETWIEVFEQAIIPFMTEGLKPVIQPRTQQMRDLNKRTSVRNQLLGTVTSIKPQMYHGEVMLALKGGEQVLAILTLESIKKLGLTEGSQAHILIRAPHLIFVTTNSKLKFSTANCLCGTVIGLNCTRLSSEIILELKGGEILKGVVPQEAIDDLGIKVGESLCGVFKATKVILAVEE